jgi:membrane-associated phospholipid phosphatase
MHVINPLIEFITNFGDLAVLLPLIVVVAVWLLVVRGLRPALWWLVAVAFCAGGTAFLKVFFYACPPVADLRSPSGHTSLSALVYGTLTAAVVFEARGWQRQLAAIAGGLFVLAIAFSRLALDVHSPAEVVLGLLLGLASLALFLSPYARSHTAPLPVHWLIVCVLLFMILLNGRELRAEEFLHAISAYFNVATVCR